MKLVKFALVVMISFPGVSGAYAQAFDASGMTYDHGKARFMGSIVNTPCSITADSIDQTIDLGSFTSKELDHGGISGSTPFEIELEDCDISEQHTVSVTFSGGADAKDNTLLGLSGSAAGAGIVIADMSGEPLDLGTESEAQTLQNGHNTLQFSAWLKGDDPADTVTPGDFTSVANFQLAYN